MQARRVILLETTETSVSPKSLVSAYLGFLLGGCRSSKGGSLPTPVVI